jgi:hypothetical protein
MRKHWHYGIDLLAKPPLRSALLGCLALVTSVPAMAQSIYPEDGWWWNPEEPGRGYLLERQKDRIFIASFHYTSLGNPEWLLIVGDYVAEPGADFIIGTMIGEVSLATDGQCLGCDYASPSVESSGQDPAAITFHSNQAATLEWAAETVELQRYFWAWENSLEQLEGNWILVTVPVEGDPAAEIATISTEQSHAIITDESGVELGSIEFIEDELLLSMSGLGEVIPVLVPESKRFYAGIITGDSDAVMGLRIDDLPLEIPQDMAKIIDIKDAIFTNTSPDCADYDNEYTAEVLDEQRNRVFTESVVIEVSGNACTLSSNSIPNHDFNDASASFATPVAQIDRIFTLVRNPGLATAPSALAQTSWDAVMLNGVVLDLLSAGCYRPADARADRNGNVPVGCNANSDWLLDPLGYTDGFGTDAHNAHTQPDGTYHYHGDPRAMFDDNSVSGVSPVIGFASDGFPIFGSYFFDERNNSIRKAVSGWTLKPGTRYGVNGPGGEHNGWYIDDYEFTGAGDLDECNGMTVKGQYGYYVTDSYPWILACLWGIPDDSFRKN